MKIMETPENTVRGDKVWTYWQGIVEIVLRVLTIVLGAFPVFISAGVLFGLTLSIVIPINNIKVTTRIYGTALAASVILLVAGIAGGIEQLILLIMRLRGYVTVEKIQKYFTRSIGSNIFQAVLLFVGGILAAVFKNSSLGYYNPIASSASSCAAFGIIGAILCGALAGWEITLVLNVWKI